MSIKNCCICDKVILTEADLFAYHQRLFYCEDCILEGIKKIEQKNLPLKKNPTIYFELFFLVFAICMLIYSIWMLKL